MACKNVCRLCDNFIMSQSVNFTGGNLIIDLPAGSYANCEKFVLWWRRKSPIPLQSTLLFLLRLAAGLCSIRL